MYEIIKQKVVIFWSALPRLVVFRPFIGKRTIALSKLIENKYS